MGTIYSYAHGISPYPLLGETIGQNLKRISLMHSDEEALVCVEQGYRATYSEFYEQTAEVAKGLLAIGMKKGDRLGIWAMNRFEWVLLQYATARIGVILVNINPAYRVNELRFVLDQSEIGVIFSSLRIKTSDYKEMLTLAAADSAFLKGVYYFDQDWDSFLELAVKVNDKDLALAESETQFDDAINIQYTSGTTGFPKGVTLTHHNILNNGYFIGVRLKYSHKDRVCIPVPFYHCFGMVIGNMCCTAHGACMVIPSESFDAEKVLIAVEKEKCTSLYGVPTMFIAELSLENFKDFDLTSLRTGVMAGSTCPEEIMRKVKTEMHMNEVSVCYGMTETSPVSIQTIIGTPIDKQVSTVGTVQDHLEIKVIDPETQKILPRGMSGELCTRGYSVMRKYWNNPSETAKVLKNNWMHTGDSAIMDEEGYIKIDGRIKDIIIRGGENISPKEVEDYLYKHPAILDVQVIGVPSDRFGEEVMAWIKVKDGHVVDEGELMIYCKDIAHYKVPKYWKFVKDYPVTISGKIKKMEMRKVSTKELGLEGLLKNGDS